MGSSAHAAGKQVRGNLESNDLSTATAITWYDAVTHEEIIVGTNENIILYLISVFNGDTARVVRVFDDIDGAGDVDAGDLLFGGSMAANQQGGWALVRGMAVRGPVKAIASGASANTKITILAEIQQRA